MGKDLIYASRACYVADLCGQHALNQRIAQEVAQRGLSDPPFTQPYTFTSYVNESTAYEQVALRLKRGKAVISTYNAQGELEGLTFMVKVGSYSLYGDQQHNSHRIAAVRVDSDGKHQRYGCQAVFGAHPWIPLAVQVDGSVLALLHPSFATALVTSEPLTAPFNVSSALVAANNQIVAVSTAHRWIAWRIEALTLSLIGASPEPSDRGKKIEKICAFHDLLIIAYSTAEIGVFHVGRAVLDRAVSTLVHHEPTDRGLQIALASRADQLITASVMRVKAWQWNSSLLEFTLIRQLPLLELYTSCSSFSESWSSITAITLHSQLPLAMIKVKPRGEWGSMEAPFQCNMLGMIDMDQGSLLSTWSERIDDSVVGYESIGFTTKATSFTQYLSHSSSEKGFYRWTSCEWGV